MKRNTANEVKVGVVVILFATALFTILFFLKDIKKTDGVTYVVQFAQAGGITPGDTVRYAGVNIGKVKNIQIKSAPLFDWDRDRGVFVPRMGKDGKQQETDQAFVTIIITDFSAFPSKSPVLTDAAEVTVTTSLMNERWIEIRPSAGGTPIPQGGTLLGRPPITMEDMMAKAEEAVDEVAQATRSINEILGDKESQQNIKKSIENFRELTASLMDVSETVRQRLNGIADRIETLTDNTNQVVLNVNEIVVRSGSRVDRITTDLTSFTGSLNRMATTNEGDIRRTVKNLNEVSQSLTKSMKTIEDLVTRKEFSEDILTTLNNIKRASQEVEGIATDIHAITADEGLKSDLKATITEARSAASGANRLIRSVNQALGVDKKSKNDVQPASMPGDTTQPTPKPGDVTLNGTGDGEAPKKGEESGFSLSELVAVDVEAEYNDRTKETVPNANALILPNNRFGVKLGLDSAGFDNLVNLQYRGKYGSFYPRIGLIRSKLGAGADIMISRNTGIFVDAYDPRDWQVDLTGRWNITRNGFYLHGGFRNLFDKNEKSAVFGIGKRF